MTNGVTSPSAGGFEFISRIHQNQNRPQTPLAKADSGGQPSATERLYDFTKSAESTTVREFSLLDLAAREFSRILPNIELLTNPVE